MRTCRGFTTTLYRGGKRGLYLRLLACFAIWTLCWRLARESNGTPSVHTDEHLAYLRHSRSLRHYLDTIHLLIEPTSPPCANLEQVPLIALVTSLPGRHAQRDAVRQTWAFHQPTFFIMGLDANRADEQLIQNYVEAKQRDDLVLFDFGDHHQNLTIKVALAMRWVLERCPQAEFLLKVEDDVLVNPWMLKEVLRDHQDSKIVGSLIRNKPVVRTQGRKGYTPPWLYSADKVPEFVSGHSYLINGDFIRSILRAAYSVPMMNAEEVYYTHLVSTYLDGYKISDDVRLQAWTPLWPPLWPPCAFWPRASVPGLGSQDMLRIWAKVQAIGRLYENNETVCESVFSMVSFIV